ncbi:MAG: OmpA family protein [Gemmatimonadota bacterium]
MAADRAIDIPVRVAAIVGREHATIRERLVPVASIQVDDVRFAFDSSFVLPEARDEFGLIDTVRRENPEAPMSLFGHADPVGEDEYNKILSGRRALAIFAVLTRRTDIWERLHAKPHGRDRWSSDNFDTIRESLSLADGTTGVPKSAADRVRLYAAYMDFLCRDIAGRPYTLDVSRAFLAGGSDTDGKGDIQGCGEFNPEIIFSRDQQATFAREPESAGGGKPVRDAANAPNRRVVALFFTPGSRVDPKTWPCPRALESTAACRKRLWSDANRRRAPGDVTREQAQTKDTFACRFYDRIAGSVPGPRLTRRNVFQYGVPMGTDAPFSAQATFRIVSEDNIQARTFAEADGFIAGKHRVFVFTRVRPGIRYRGEVVDGGLTFEMFSFTDLSRVLDPADSLNFLQLSQPPALQALPAPPPANFRPFAGPDDAVDFTAVDDAAVTRDPITTARIV